MKSIPLALAGLVALSPAWAADDAKQPNKPSQKKIGAASPKQETALETLAATGMTDGATAQPDSVASQREM
ncbi:MAG: hypothetical protein KGM95_07120, partial [Betaproteobacteria bacterium]|nr:hypothetical protein [Betaproteobacteria bacterium]